MSVTEVHRAKRMVIGAGMASGFFLALIGYWRTSSAWWLLAPALGFAVGWRVAMGRWPFARTRD